MTQDSLLAVDDVHASYGESRILQGVSLNVGEGEVVSLLGRNGAGKTTTLRSIFGIVRVTAGSIRFDGDEITNWPDHRIANLGIRYVPENRQVFPDLTVVENLRMGAVSGGDGILTIDEAFEQFPRLRERRTNAASQLSGGEQQMLVIARALVGPTKLLLLDEPSEGLAPQIVEDVIGIVEEISSQGVPILLVEQNVRAAMAVADRHYVIDKGQIVFEGSTDELDDATTVKERHLGVSAEATGFD